MEEKLEEKVALEEKVPEDDQGGIRRRLRDRDLLKKRKAEAEAQVTNQWVYGVESRKRARREPSSIPRKKGRPRKNIPVEQEPGNSEIQELETPEQAVEPTIVPPLVSASVSPPALTSAPLLIPPPASVSPPELTSAPLPIPPPASVSPPELTSVPLPIPLPASVSAPALTAALVPPPLSVSVPFSVSAPIQDPVSVPIPVPASVSALSPAPIPIPNTVSASAPIPVPVSAPASATVVIPAQVSAPGLNLPKVPDVVSIPTTVPASETIWEMKLPSETHQEVLVEDIGSDEEEDRTRSQDKLVIDQGGVEDLSPGVAESNKEFLDPVFVSSQNDSQAGNVI